MFTFESCCRTSPITSATCLWLLTSITENLPLPILSSALLVLNDIYFSDLLFCFIVAHNKQVSSLRLRLEILVSWTHVKTSRPVRSPSRLPPCLFSSHSKKNWFAMSCLLSSRVLMLSARLFRRPLFMIISIIILAMLCFR